MHKLLLYIIFVTVLMLIAVGCSRISNTTPTPLPIITLEQTIAISYQSIPDSIAERAPLNVWWTPQIAPKGAWQMEFHNVNATPEELGWVANPSGTPIVDLNYNPESSPILYQLLLIDIDGASGEVFLKMAATSLARLNDIPPPLTVVPPRTSSTK
jgi:hypothetical protein